MILVDPNLFLTLERDYKNNLKKLSFLEPGQFCLPCVTMRLYVSGRLGVSPLRSKILSA